MEKLCESRGFILYAATNEEICRGKAENRTDIYIATMDALYEILKAGGKYGDTITAGNVLCTDLFGMRPDTGCGLFLNIDALDTETVNNCIEIFKAGASAAIDRIIYVDDEDMEKPLNSIFNAACDTNHLIFFSFTKWIVLSNKTAEAIRKSHSATAEDPGQL